MTFFFFFFLFSSRRRHTRSLRHWSSDVCSSDLILLTNTDLVSPAELDALEARIHGINAVAKIHRPKNCDLPLDRVLDVGGFNLSRATELDRSEERRVGKECRARTTRTRMQKKTR